MLAGAVLLVAALAMTCAAGEDAGGEGGSGGVATTTTSPTTTTTSSSSSTNMSTISLTGTGGQGGSGPSGWSDGPPALNNDADCLAWESIHPDAGEEGQLYAVRLTPPSYPYEVSGIHYELWHAPSNDYPCDAQPAHRAEVFVATTDAPPASPSVTKIDNKAVSLSGDGIRVVKSSLPSPITLKTGEHLFVALELAGLSTCLMTCKDAKVTTRDYWSNATKAPYSWATVASFGVDAHARIGANGSAK